MLEPGAVVSGYRVESVLGKGAMGEVFKVRHLERGTLHALKYLPLANRKARQRILREGQAQTRLHHPNVVTLTEVLEIDGDPGLIMEYVDGPTLEAWLAGHQATPAEAEALFRLIVAGVAHAHRKGLVHRDLKPANVLLAKVGGSLVPKVADFGIAKIIDTSGPLQAGLTRTGTSLGSPAYMAPEQIRDAREVDPAADVWSLGCLLYELLLHRRAFDGADLLDLMNAVQAGRFLPPRELRPDLPERFVRAIEGSLQVERDDRFPTCDDLISALDDGGHATITHGVVRTSTPAPVGRPARPKTSPPPEVEPPGPDPRLLIGGAALAGLVVVAVAAALLL